MDERGCRLVALFALAAAPYLGGCGKGTQATPDGGDGAPISWDGAIAGMYAFEVTAVLHAKSNGPPPPPTNGFTLVVDTAARLAIAGGKGQGATVALTTTDGRTFRSAAGFTVGGGGSTVNEVRYDTFDVTLTDGLLTGTATGTATISAGEQLLSVQFMATLAGRADESTPALLAFATPANPFDWFELFTSEPLPTRATARLVADDGASIDLVPRIVDGAVPFIVSFAKPDIVLRAGQTYVVTFDGLIDFAGNVDRASPSLRITSFGDAPLVPEDGFESAVAGSEVGGALVVTGEPLPAIAGSASLYTGGKLDTPRGIAAPVFPLGVRLARQAGDTMLRFTYRVVGVTTPPTFPGGLWVGAEGAATGKPISSFASTEPLEMLTVGGQAVYASAEGTMAVPLPADATDDVLLVIAPSIVPSGVFQTPPVGLLIDDVRLE